MGRRKKRKRHFPEQKALRKKDEIFNPAFKTVISLKEKGINAPKETEENELPEPVRDPDETQLFNEAMSGVRLLSGDRTKVTPTTNLNVRPVHPAKKDDLEAVAHLCDLVSGSAEMDITFSDEYIEGSVHGFSQNLMKKLIKGEFPIQDYVDLHGLIKEEAESRIRAFLLQSYRLGLRCVLVVHGRGLNSENHIPVLKERLPIWLSRGPVRKVVLAFSTARPYDGGTGAIYVLLKKRKGAL